MNREEIFSNVMLVLTLGAIVYLYKRYLDRYEDYIIGSEVGLGLNDIESYLSEHE